MNMCSVGREMPKIKERERVDDYQENGRARCPSHSSISVKMLLPRQLLQEKAFKRGLAYLFRNAIHYLHDREHGAVAES